MRISPPDCAARLLRTLLILVAAGIAAPAANAGGQAERALAGGRALFESGELRPGTALRLGFKQGNINAFLVRDLELQREWERLTGVTLDARIIPQWPTHDLLAEQDGAWMYWLPRFLAQAAPVQRLFDEQMRPQLDTPAGIAATESYVAAVRYSPPGTGLPGDREYLAALDRNLTAAARGEASPREAMARTAAEWESITDRHGRAAQRRHWLAFLDPRGAKP
jgi:hypothetical protein